ncbi:MAG: IS4 family transposase [Methanosarcinales archaeon]
MTYLNGSKREYYTNFSRIISPIRNYKKKYDIDKRASVFTVDRLIRLFLLVNFLKVKYATLRGITAFSSSIICNVCTGIPSFSRSGFSDSLRRVPASLFLDILFDLIYLTGKKRKDFESTCNRVKIFDTTFIMLSLKLFPWAQYTQKKSGIKIGLRIDEGQALPDNIVIDLAKSNDNNFFEKMIDFDIHGITYLFDRGFQRIKTLDKIHESKNFFITRMFPSYKYQIVDTLKIKVRENDTIKIIKDEIVKIGSGKNESENLFRLITAINKKGEELLFLTNRFDLSALEVCELYRLRWEIEILFKWLKQYLKINKFISYSPNGVMIQIYMALITHILILLYRQKNRLNHLGLLETLRIIEVQIINECMFFMFLLGIEFCNKIRRIDGFKGF